MDNNEKYINGTATADPAVATAGGEPRRPPGHLLISDGSPLRFKKLFGTEFNKELLTVAARSTF